MLRTKLKSNEGVLYTSVLSASLDTSTDAGAVFYLRNAQCSQFRLCTVLDSAYSQEFVNFSLGVHFLVCPICTQWPFPEMRTVQRNQELDHGRLYNDYMQAMAKRSRALLKQALLGHIFSRVSRFGPWYACWSKLWGSSTLCLARLLLDWAKFEELQLLLKWNLLYFITQDLWVLNVGRGCSEPAPHLYEEPLPIRIHDQVGMLFVKAWALKVMRRLQLPIMSGPSSWLKWISPHSRKRLFWWTAGATAQIKGWGWRERSSCKQGTRYSGLPRTGWNCSIFALKCEWRSWLEYL